MKVEFSWDKPINQILNSAVGGERTQLFTANAAKKLMIPYVPFLNGPLSTNVSTGVDSKGGYVHYKQPYAGYQYYGQLMLGVNSHSPYAKYGERKETTARPLNYNKSRHPLATSEWDKAMKSARMRDLSRAVQTYINKGR